MAERALSGAGRVTVAAPPDAVLAALLDPGVLHRLIPGAEQVERTGDGRFRAVLTFGVGPLRSRCDAGLALSREGHPCRLTLAGNAAGLFGRGRAVGHVTLAATTPGGTVLDWRYHGAVSGPVALAGGRVLRFASSRFVQSFFAALAGWVEREPVR